MTKGGEKMHLKAIPSLLAHGEQLVHGEQLEAFYDEEEENLRLKVFPSSLSRNEGSCFCRILRAKKRQSGLQLSFREERQAQWLTRNTIDRTLRRLSKSQ